MATYYGKNGELRFYDGTTPTPIYMVLRFSDINLTCPEGPGQVEEIIRTNRMQHDANTHYIQGGDEVILEPLTLTTSFKLESGTFKELIYQFLAIRFSNGQQVTWQAGTGPTNLVTTKGTSAGRIPGLTTSKVALPQFSDPMKKCVNVECLWDDLTGSKTGRKYTEVLFRPNELSLNESPEAVTCNLTGHVYGDVLQITAFSAGTLIS